MTSTQPPQVLRGITKQVLSGDAIIVRGQPKGGPPPERQINFSNVVAPRLARRGTNNVPETQDEPYAWESREFLRKKVIGKEVLFVIETKTPTGREYGAVYIGSDITTGENLTETMVSEGLVGVRRESIRGESRLIELEDQAKAQKKGKWAGNDTDNQRNIKWNIENLRTFVDKAKREPIPAVIEHVRDGSTVRAFLLPDFYHITLMISGIRCPMFKLDADNKPDKSLSEPFAEEARYYTESRLLQRDVEIILETFNNNNFVGTILHPNGNIAESLLREGFAKCVDWSMTTVTGGPEKYRQAEKQAKERKLRVWTDYKPTGLQISDKDKEFTGKVVEVVNGDALNVKRQDGTVKKLFIASIRPPRSEGETPKPAGKIFRPLYEIPWLFEAREFLRKKLIGQKVHCSVDYIQPAQNNYPEKTCCTVKFGDINIGEAMVSKGLVTVIKYKQDDDQRASCYDDLLSAEAKAIKSGKGLHNKKDVPIHRVADVSSDLSKAKAFLPFLQRAGSTEAVVEFVASGSRMRLFIPRETCLITFLLGGISCPRGSRPAPGGGGTLPGEPFGEEALRFTKTLILQREVTIEVDTMDKGGNFIGWLTVDGKNLSVLLVEEGLSTMHVTAESSKFSHQLTVAQQNAKKKQLNVWANYVEEEKEEKIEDVSTERKMDYKPMMITGVLKDGKMYGQYCSDGSSLEQMMDSLAQEFTTNPPLGGSYTPKKGDLCAAQFVDGAWYRAKVEKSSGGQVAVFYVDYGNREVLAATKCTALPGGFTAQKPFAHEMQIALIKFHGDEDTVNEALEALKGEVMDREVLVNKEYRIGGVEYVSVQRSDTKADVARSLLSQGFVLVDNRREKKLQSLLSDYKSAQDEAKRKHLNIWCYGDVTEDDAFEFGMER